MKPRFIHFSCNKKDIWHVHVAWEKNWRLFSYSPLLLNLWPHTAKFLRTRWKRMKASLASKGAHANPNALPQQPSTGSLSNAAARPAAQHWQWIGPRVPSTRPPGASSPAQPVNTYENIFLHFHEFCSVVLSSNLDHLPDTLKFGF